MDDFISALKDLSPLRKGGALQGWRSGGLWTAIDDFESLTGVRPIVETAQDLAGIVGRTPDGYRVGFHVSTSVQGAKELAMDLSSLSQRVKVRYDGIEPWW